VYARRGAKKTGGADYSAGVQPIGWVNKLLMDYRGVLVSGPVGLYLWPRDRANPIGMKSLARVVGNNRFRLTQAHAGLVTAPYQGRA